MKAMKSHKWFDKDIEEILFDGDEMVFLDTADNIERCSKSKDGNNDKGGANMKAMKSHKWFDKDIEEILFDGDENIREITLKDSNEGAILITRKDVVALAKEFGFSVYPYEGDDILKEENRTRSIIKLYLKF